MRNENIDKNSSCLTVVSLVVIWVLCIRGKFVIPHATESNMSGYIQVHTRNFSMDG